MVGVAQFGRALDCGSSRRGFKSRHPPIFCQKQKMSGEYAKNIARRLKTGEIFRMITNRAFNYSLACLSREPINEAISQKSDWRLAEGKSF